MEEVLITKEQFLIAKELITNIIAKSELEIDPPHSLNTLKWLLILKPDSDYGLQIAALAHDIERGVAPRIRGEVGESYFDYKQRHAKRSAEVIGDLLNSININTKQTKWVMNLVENHEVGGDEEMELIKDADSISFFDVNLENFVTGNMVEVDDAKIKMMFDRASDRARIEILKLNLPVFIRVLILK
jgi:hypothetical protein